MLQDSTSSQRALGIALTCLEICVLLRSQTDRLNNRRGDKVGVFRLAVQIIAPLAAVGALGAACLSIASSPAWAQSEATSVGSPTEPEIESEIEEVTIVGEAAGPGLWKVRNGDNTLYILGTLSPLPKKMEWRSREVESVLSRAKQVIPARSSVNADIGPIKAVQLYMQYRKLRGNEDKQTLEQVLPADLYQRFEGLRQKYAPRDRDMLQRRPLLAAGELWSEALSRSGLTGRNDVSRKVEKLAKSSKVPIVLPKIFIDDPKGALAEFGLISRDSEVPCMRSTLGRMESDLDGARRRAEAWAVGDIEALRSRASSDQQEACWSALQQSPKVAAIRQQFEDEWFKLAVKAVETHDVALAVVPISELFGRNGVIARMQARGYSVDDP
ncbi:MAG: hypothetical protein FJ160_04125 [Gammaproteobacteria bacterium]|nr:hypothetical protein [Gammaproteobacteria bacterium]